jgi:anti-sigma regulatory factor (Ser/Thr protein kinase)
VKIHTERGQGNDGATTLKASQGGEKIALLITDVGLSAGVNGRQLADAIRQTEPKLYHWLRGERRRGKRPSQPAYPRR